MNANFYIWGMAIGTAAIALILVAIYWWSVRVPKPKHKKAAVFLEDITSCDGCGCLLLKGPQFKQPSTVGNRWRCKAGGIYLMDADAVEWIQEHYLCLHCQDGKPLARGGTIPPPPSETAKPC